MPDGSVCQSGAVRRIHPMHELCVTVAEVNDARALRSTVKTVGDPMQSLKVAALYAVDTLKFEQFRQTLAGCFYPVAHNHPLIASFRNKPNNEQDNRASYDIFHGQTPYCLNTIRMRSCDSGCKRVVS